MNKVLLFLAFASSFAFGQSLPLSSAATGVTLSTSQTITGAKTFSATLTSTTTGYGLNTQAGSTFGMSYSGSDLVLRSGGPSGVIYFQAGGGASTYGAFSPGTLSVNSLNVPVVHGSGTAPQAIEAGSAAMTASELAVTFSTAFGAAPTCTCTHVNTTNANACNIKSAAQPSTTTVTFAVTTGGTDIVHWICIGQR